MGECLIEDKFKGLQCAYIKVNCINLFAFIKVDELVESKFMKE